MKGTGSYSRQASLTKRGTAARLQFSIVLCALALASLAGCRAGYVARVGIQHLRYVGAAVPIAEEIERTEDRERRELLQLALDSRAFAEDQGLDVGGSYLKVADTVGMATAYVVTAAYADRLEPYTWSYPIVGEIPYRGYFDRARADEYAERLAADGLDTYVVEASGYSTLGWFDDPLPSTALDSGAVGLASLIFHELTHQTVYVPGHVAFNETMASAVAARMTVDFFESRGEAERAEEAVRRRERWLEQGELCDALAERLRAHFAAHAGGDADVARSGRDEIYERAKVGLREVGLLPDDDAVVAGIDVNNASFLAIYRYRQDADLIDAFFGRFASIAEALAVLKEAAGEGRDDPYETVAQDPATGA